jgi:hypothetical protein
MQMKFICRGSNLRSEKILEGEGIAEQTGGKKRYRSTLTALPEKIAPGGTG